uniref:Uncharacterized protein n=1 Tax=Ralstonia solanacearum TaxID=305 RepID=A0A0S4TN66_RALSL|nr:protein of unknown function [Ralstonia solanacearum]
MNRAGMAGCIDTAHRPQDRRITGQAPGSKKGLGFHNPRPFALTALTARPAQARVPLFG